jgi:hypothetical protein
MAMNTIEEAIFHAASELNDPQVRAAFLDRTCGAQGPLRERLEALLEADRRAGQFLAQDPLELGAQAGSAPGPASAPPYEPPGTVIGRYKLLEKIGEGGMGVVYMAQQEDPVRRRVALKIIKLGMDTRQVVARFEAERQALALMDHPNIAKVLDGGATDTGRPYFVMELVQGVPITEFCDKNRLSTQERIKLLIPVCQAIQSAHQKGIIHRDIKPTNLLVTLNPDGSGHPMVIDFGVAKAVNQKLTEKTVFTNYGTMIGSPAYMSPEQAEMSRLDVDTRSDIYSLGVLLYELLTGTTPFPDQRLRGVGYNEMQRIILEEEPERPSTRLRRRSVEGQPSPPVTRHSPLATDLDWIVMKCLEKDRTRRYDTANGLARDLERHLHNEPVAARPPSNLYRLGKLVRRNRLLCGAVGAVAATLVLGIIASAREAARARRAEHQQSRLRSDADTARQHAQAEARRAEAAAIELRRTLAASDFADAEHLIKADDAADAVAHLSRILQADPKNRAALSQLVTLLTYHSWAVPTLVLKHPDRVVFARFSPDGRRIVTASQDYTARVWDARTSLPVTPPLQHSNLVYSARFSPDGGRVVTACADGTARVWDAQTGRALTEPLKHGDRVWSAEFSRDSKRIVTASEDRTARVWDTATGQLLTEPLRHRAEVWCAQFSPDGQRVVTASTDKTARVWDASTGQPLTEPMRHDSELSCAQFSPDGKRVVTTPLLTAYARMTLGPEAQFSPDGQRLVVASDLARLWDAQTGQPLTELLISSDNAARVWDVGFVPAKLPDWLLPLAEAISGRRLNEKGLLEETPIDRPKIIAQVRRDLASQPESGDGVSWGRWLLSNPAERAISPLATLTTPAYIENLIKQQTKESLEEAATLAFGNPALLRRISEARNRLGEAKGPIEAGKPHSQ